MSFDALFFAARAAKAFDEQHRTLPNGDDGGFYIFGAEIDKGFPDPIIVGTITVATVIRAKP